MLIGRNVTSEATLCHGQADGDQRAPKEGHDGWPHGLRHLKAVTSKGRQRCDEQQDSQRENDGP